MNSHSVCVAASAALVAASVACGGESDRWIGTIDTLENGATLIRSVGEGMWDEETAWRLVEDLRIGSLEGEGPETFAQVVAVEVDAAGRIYVLDRQIQEVRVFDADGSYVRTIGRPGEGPGEFRGANGLAFDPEGRLWVVDQRNKRFEVFDTSGAYVESYRALHGTRAFMWTGAITESGVVYDPSNVRRGEEWEGVLLRYDRAAQAYTDTLELPPGGRSEVYNFQDERGLGSIMMVPFASGGGASHIDRRGYLWYGTTDRYRLYQLDLEMGDTLRAVERDAERIPVTAEEREEALERVRSVAERNNVTRFDESRIPDTKPAFAGLVVGAAGYLWVWRPYWAERGGTLFDVFDPEGRYLGELHAEAEKSFARPVVRGERLYFVTTDEFDVPYVVRYRIEGRRPMEGEQP